MKQQQGGWEFQLNKQQKRQELPDPYGYTKSASGETIEDHISQSETRSLMEKKISAFSIAGANQILIAFLMLWLTGGGLNIFTIIITFQFLKNPLMAILSSNEAFKQFESAKIPLLRYKALYISIQCIILLIGLYKLKSMGLLPFSATDWTELIPTYHQTHLSLDLS